LGIGSLSTVVEAVRKKVRSDATWEADVVPLPGVADDPTARPVATLVAADGFIVYGNIDGHPSPEPEYVAGLIARGVRAAGADLAFRPPALAVRHQIVAAHLAKLLEADGIVVQREPTLPTLQEIGVDLVSHLSGSREAVPGISLPHSWSAWGLPNDVIAGVFAAAATFFRTRPWDWLGSERLLDLDLTGGARWTASVLGAAGEEFGLVLYESRRDFDCMFAEGGPSQAFKDMRSAVLSLTFSDRTEIPKPMAKETARAGWDVAGPNAYPVLFALNTPGGGVSRTQFAELTQSLAVVVRFVAANKASLGNELASAESFEWVDPETASRVVCDPGSPDDVGVLWDPVVSLTPSLPEGPNANPRSALDRDVDGEALLLTQYAIVDRFGNQPGVAPAKLEQDVENARFFADFVGGFANISLAAVTEFDLRTFLYDWFPRKVATSRTHAIGVRASLRRFFEYLAKHEGIVYPWAQAILRDKEMYELRWDTFPGGHWWDTPVREWMAELTADLEARMMLPSAALADVGAWGATMGMQEAELHHELQRRWLLWRDEVIRAGIVDPSRVREELVHRQHDWERRPRAADSRRSPSDLIATECEARPR
jgi:hypothetical protein